MEGLADEDVVKESGRGPVRPPRSPDGQAAGRWGGKTAAIRSSDSMRWMGRGFFFPPRKRRTARERFRFQRQREVNMGEARTACSKPCRPYRTGNGRRRCRRGKLCWGPSDRRTASSFGRRLELEVEGGAELSCTGARPNRFFDPSAEGGALDDHLHPAGLVEEPLEDDVVPGGEDAEFAQAGGRMGSTSWAGVGRLEATGPGHVVGRPAGGARRREPT